MWVGDYGGSRRRGGETDTTLQLKWDAKRQPLFIGASCLSLLRRRREAFKNKHTRNPLQVLVPDLTLKTIQQSTTFSFSGANNELTVTLTSNCDFPEGSKVTITGLTRSQTATSATLSVHTIHYTPRTQPLPRALPCLHCRSERGEPR